MCEEEIMDDINPHMVRRAYEIFERRDRDELLRFDYVIREVGPIYFGEREVRETEFTIGAMGLTRRDGIDYIKVDKLLRGLAGLLE
ncbi:MAG: hypothetical protein ABIB71_02470 [Candidatus Woesearchaeota archaeon]